MKAASIGLYEVDVFLSTISEQGEVVRSVRPGR